MGTKRTRSMDREDANRSVRGGRPSLPEGCPTTRVLRGVPARRGIDVAHETFQSTGLESVLAHFEAPHCLHHRAKGISRKALGFSIFLISITFLFHQPSAAIRSSNGEWHSSC